jgi:hypothetical protein
MRLSSLFFLVGLSHFVSVSPALADTYYFTQATTCTGCIAGFVTTSSISEGVVQVSVNIGTNTFAFTGAGEALFAFNLNGVTSTPAMTIVDFPALPSPTNTHWGLISGVDMDGQGYFQYGIKCLDNTNLQGNQTNCPNGGGTGLTTPFIFNLAATGLTLDSFNLLSTTPPGSMTANFAVDVACSGTCTGGPTGIIGARGTSVPDGGVTLMLLGGALVGLETLRRKFRV